MRTNEMLKIISRSIEIKVRKNRRYVGTWGIGIQIYPCDSDRIKYEMDISPLNFSIPHGKNEIHLCQLFSESESDIFTKAEQTQIHNAIINHKHISYDKTSFDNININLT